MPKIIQKSLIIKKQTPFDKIRTKLLMLFYKEEYKMEQNFNSIIKINRPNPKNILIPKAIGNEENEKYKRL